MTLNFLSELDSSISAAKSSLLKELIVKLWKSSAFVQDQMKEKDTL